MMNDDRNDRIQRAVELFDQQQYREAFIAFVEIYSQCTNDSMRRDIFQMLGEAYYVPNEPELRENYEGNLACLKTYPYFLGKPLPEFDALRFRLFPVDDELYYYYDCRKDCFVEEYAPHSDRQIKYFFEHLDQPFQVKDEDNFYNLTFLNDNMRSSEDFAGDNHVYLLYTAAESLERLMLTCDLKPVLEQQKFVFLVGKNIWNKYPIDFQGQFGIDYAKMKPAPIRIEEVKRICFWYKHAYSGTELSMGVLGALSTTQVYSGRQFNQNSKVCGENLGYTDIFRTVMSNIDASYTVEQISQLISSEEYDIRLENLEEYLSWLRQRRAAPHNYTVKELFVGYFLFRYEKRGLNPRIAPLLVFDPHIWVTSAYDKIVLSFPYHTVLTSMREPIMTFGRGYLYGLIGWDRFQTQYMLGSDYCHAQFLPQELRSCYYGFRFEDLKTKPETVCRALCRHLNVPFEQQMLETEAPLADKSGHITRGFDQAPLHRNIDSVLSEFDQLRLKIFYEPIHTYYGYPTFSSQEYPLPETLVRELFRYPLRFEKFNQVIFPDAPPQQTLHAWIQDILQGAWRTQPVFPKLIPLGESGNE